MTKCCLVVRVSGNEACQLGTVAEARVWCLRPEDPASRPCMAGSPDAPHALRSVPPSCTWRRLGSMLDDRYVRYHNVEIDVGGPHAHARDRQIARQADGAVLATYGETIVLATVVSAKEPKPGHRLLPADRQLPGKDLRRRQDPGRLLQARRPPDREGDAGLPPDRPPDPPAVRRRLQERDAGRRHRPLSTTSRTIPTSCRWSPPPPR